MSMKNIFLLLFTLLIAFPVQMIYSQSDSPVRMEIPVKDDTEIYKVVPCDDNGLMIIYLSSDNDGEGNMIWIAALLDKEVKET